jgi:hypothetical protein
MHFNRHRSDRLCGANLGFCIGIANAGEKTLRREITFSFPAPLAGFAFFAS